MTDQVQLSDGNLAEIPEGTNPADIPKIAAQAEAQLADYYGKQAAAQNSPVTAGSKVYSATTSYPNNVFGQGMAWLDHNAGGNWANRNVVQPVDAAQNWAFSKVGGGGTLEGPAMRAVSNALTWEPDLAGAVYNTVKHYTPLGTEYDAPNLARAVRSGTGFPEMSPDAPFWQRVVESAATAKAAGAPLFRSLVGGLTGTLGSDIGGYVGGEGGALAGGILGGLGGNPAGKGVAKTLAPALRDPEAEATWNAAENIRPTTPGGNFQGLTSPPIPGLGDLSQFTPSFTALANPSGQRIANSLSSFPFSGRPIEQATEATRNFIQQARNASASDLAGTRGLPSDPVSPATIGPVLTEGAQQAILALKGHEQAKQDAIDTAMAGAGRFPATNTVNEGFNQVAGNQRGEAQTAATLSRVGEITDASPGGPNYRGPDAPLPAQPSWTWGASKDWIGDLNASLAQSGRPSLPPDIAAALKTVANQERETAANAVQPGLGTQFRQANESYARALPVLDRLYDMGGQPLGTTGRFTDVPREQDAARQLTGNLQSPEYLSDILMHPDFPAANRLNAVGQHVSTLGNQGGPNNFRPEKFVTDYTKDRAGIDALAAASTGAPSAATNVLDNAATVAKNFSTPTSRFGLIKSLGSAAAVAKLMEGTGKLIEYGTHWKPAEWAGVPVLGRLYASALESDPMKRAMANQPQNWADLANAIPVAGAVTQTNPPARHVWVTRP